MLWQFIQRHAYKAIFLAFAISKHIVFKPVNWMLWIKGLKELTRYEAVKIGLAASSL